MPRTFVNSPMDVRFVLLSLFLVLLPVQAKEKKRDDSAVLQEEQQDYYKKWLKEDVVYIITDEELDVFDDPQHHGGERAVHRAVLAPARPGPEDRPQRVQGRALPADRLCQRALSPAGSRAG